MTLGHSLWAHKELTANKISNVELLRICEQEIMANILIKRRWRWIGHVLRRDKDDNARIALYWTPEGKRKRGRPKITWHRTVMEELRAMGETWDSIGRKAQDRQEWRSFVAALNARGHHGQ